ncbi:hypothetical protein IPG41_07235 [Candidatus Peregrinibacteria bacterium]|nr:MAG: hypothetical protein IPG41_07235 [Candidatus Peregrinibacteria bacterium]
MKSFYPLVFGVLLLSSCANLGSVQEPSEEDAALDEAVSEDEEGGNKVDLQIGLIALEDNGESGPLVGCGDSLVLVTQSAEGLLTPEEKIEAALEALFAIKDPSYGQSGLYTALDEAELSVDSVLLSSSQLTVELSGTLSSGGTCDDPRIVQQIKETAVANSEVSAPLEVKVLLNDRLLEEQLNAKGE